jgi:hypothetical protein
MSADNIILIAEYPTENGIRFRVFHVFAIGNAEGFKNISHYLTWILSEFPGLTAQDVYLDYKTAKAAAKALENSLPIVEYGIQHIQCPEEIPVEHFEAPNWRRQ